MEDLNSTPPLTLSKDAVVSTSRKNRTKSTIEDGVSTIATIVCQTLLYSAHMVGARGFDVAIVLEKAAAMCKAEEGQPVATMETWALAGVDSEAQSRAGANLYVEAAKIQTMLRRPAIERASLIPGIIVLDNAQNSLQIVGLGGQVLTPWKVLLDSRAQPLILGKAAVRALGLQQGALETHLLTINTSMGGLEKAIGITIQPLVVKFEPHDVMDSSTIKVKAIATEAESYDVLVGVMVLYPMDFTINF